MNKYNVEWKKRWDFMDINNIRKDFPLLSRTMMDHPLIYFDNAATTLKPQCVIDAVTGYYTQMGANAHRGDYELSAMVDDAYEAARKTVARFSACTKRKADRVYQRDQCCPQSGGDRLCSAYAERRGCHPQQRSGGMPPASCRFCGQPKNARQTSNISHWMKKAALRWRTSKRHCMSGCA